MSVRNTLLVFFALFLSANITVQAQRLPAGVHPEHYRLMLTPDLRTATFSGEETIDLMLDAPSKSVTLNAAEIKFGEVKAYILPTGAYAYGKLGSQPTPLGALETDKHPQIATTTMDGAKEQATFTFANELPAGRVTLAIR
jgi:hypothetical protein